MLSTEPAVSLYLSGLFLFCLNSNDRCEIGFLECDRHKLLFDIQKIVTDPETGNKRSIVEAKTQSFVENLVEKKQDMWISTTSANGVRKYINNDIQFDSINGQGDPQDFRWIVDMEGEAFRKSKVTLTQSASLKPKLYINSGTIYTANLSEESFMVESLIDPDYGKSIGKIAYRIGVDIAPAAIYLSNFNPQEPDSLKDTEKKSLPLEITGDARYVITIDNLCPPRKNTGQTSDFDLFFNAVSKPQDERFALRRIVEAGTQGIFGTPAPDIPNFVQDDHVVDCSGAYLSQTQSLNP